jgi:hypothetical protein
MRVPRRLDGAGRPMMWLLPVPPLLLALVAVGLHRRLAALVGGVLRGHRAFSHSLSGRRLAGRTARPHGALRR